MNPSHTFALVTLVISITLMAILVAALFRSNAPRLPISLMTILMVCQLYLQIAIVAWTSDHIENIWPVLARSAYPFQFSSSPLVYLYVLSLTRQLTDWRGIRWFHYMPLLIGILWYFMGDFLSQNLVVDKYLRNVVGFLLAVPYAWAARKAIQQFELEVKNERSSITELHLPWLRFLLVVCYGSLLLNFLDIVTGPYIQLWMYRGAIINLALIGLTYYGLKASPLFETTIVKPPEPQPPLNSLETARMCTKLLKSLNEDKLYLRPQIRLADIAKELGIKPYKLSEVINQGLNSNFYDLINGLRVEHAIRILLDPSKNHLNLLGIAMDSGFNSKSVFNEYFKRKTGKTPSEFRLNESKTTELTS